MKKRISSAALGLAIASTLCAAPLSPQQALERVHANAPAKVRSMKQANLRLNTTFKSASGVNAAYLFTPEDRPGFLLLGADDLSAPLLGYSDTGSFDFDNCPPALKWWVQEYGRQADYAASKGAKAKAVYAPAEWTAIAPLVKTTWDQGAPYNKMCPKINGQATYTGCVATSFAQVMNYFKYPEIGKGYVKYTSNKTSYFMAFDQTPFAWDDMIDSYSGNNYTDAQANAVAYLMKACGYSVEMGYGVQASGAASYKLAQAAVQYFDYDPGIQYEDRSVYSSNDWSKMVYDNLKNIGPIIYNGTAIDGGHSFVCDGYDGNGYFHINWGWSGNSDGYYLLDNLTPEIQGAGGASGGFNFSQDALFKMQKPTGQPVDVSSSTLMVYGTVNASILDNTVSLVAVNSSQPGWANCTFSTLTLTLHCALESASGDVQYLDAGINRTSGVVELESGRLFGCPGAKILTQLPAGLADGTYKLTIGSKDFTTENAPWTPFTTFYGNANYCWVNVEGGKYSVTNAQYADLDYIEGAITTPLYRGRNAMVQVKVKNDSELQLTKCLEPILIADNLIQYDSDYVLLTVDPGQEVTAEWLVKFYKNNNPVETSEFTLALMDMDTHTIVGYYGKYNMESTTSGFTLKLDQFSIADTEKTTIDINGRTFKNVFLPGDKTVVANLKYHVSAGYFDTNLRVGLTWYNPYTEKWEIINDQIYYHAPFLGNGEEQEIPIKVDLNSYADGGIYRLQASYVKAGRNQLLGSCDFTFDPTGINEIINDSDNAEIEYFNLQGVKVTNPRKGEVLIKTQAGKAEKIIF